MSEELTDQAKRARSLRVSARTLGGQRLGAKRGASAHVAGSKISLKAAKKGINLYPHQSLDKHQRSLQSHRSPLRKLESKVRKLAKRFDPIAKKKLPRGPRTILGGFAVPGIVRKITERVQSLESKARSKKMKAGGYIPRGGGEA